MKAGMNMEIRINIEVETWPITRLIPRVTNPRTHTREQVAQVAQQTRELGIRMAIGAQRADLLWMVLGRGLRLTAVGIGIGLLLSAAATRLLGGLLYGMSPLDPVSFAAASLAWTVVAMLASYMPARRAMKVDPVVALRWE
jgi:putative ABC transport system permease protein